MPLPFLQRLLKPLERHLQNFERHSKLLESHLQKIEMHLQRFEMPLQKFERHLQKLLFHLQKMEMPLQKEERTPPHLPPMKPIFWDSEEIDPYTGQKYTWDSPNPNVTWDGVREPGDEGYVPPPVSSVANPTQTNKKMKRTTYYPTNVPEQIIWLTNFFAKLRIHAAALGVSNTTRDAIVADARWLIYVLGSFLPALRASSKASTEWVREAQSGTGDAVMVLPVFEPPPLPAADAEAGLPAVVPVAPGALERIISLVQVIQEAPGYTASIATDLGTVGTVMTTPDMETIHPEFEARLSGSTVFLDWGWGGNRAFLDLIQLQVDRGSGWTDLAYDTTPGYTDTHPHPATPTKWKYRGIFRVGDAQVGVWSPEVSVIVGV